MFQLKIFSKLDLSRASHQDCYLMAKGIEQNGYQTVIDNLQKYIRGSINKDGS